MVYLLHKIKPFTMRKILLLTLLLGWLSFLHAQQTINLEDVEPGRFDQGKMWTFEHPPVAYFEEAYGFKPSEEWMEDVRKSALRFASWCSASFISGQGLIMTNHHCSRSVTASVMKEGENFDENGFYAATMEEERQVPGLFVDQLVMIADITDEVKKRGDMSPEEALEAIQTEYSEKEAWQNLKLETRTFYSGGQYCLYGFKTYNDIRLVLYPELSLGYFGGDPDNFTYPRYNLDFTFFRAYDENGEPLQPANYFEFNPGGAAENEPVFIIGNPGSTGRYLTMSQLYYQKDVTAPAILSYLGKRKEILLKAAEGIEDVYKKDSVTNLAFGLSNSEKAYTGRLEGFYNPVLMTKKEKKEQEVRSNVAIEGTDPWVELEENIMEARKYYADMLFLSPNALKGKINQLIHKLPDYQAALESEDEENIKKATDALETSLAGFDQDFERALFATLLEDLETHSQGGYIDDLLNGQNPYERATTLINESILLQDPQKFFKLKAKKLDKEPLMEFAKVLPAKLAEAGAKMSAISKENNELQKKIMNLQFQLSGISSPPDATFSLRMADGVVKSYEYNGTIAPTNTTYFGLYDRHYSHQQEYPWDLPERWSNPPLELLKAPLNFVCTADIIGGNSGSPVINRDAEVVGLVFDGNIDSLPGYFIFDDTYNRTVSVHAGGIAAAVKYIYNADRLLKELNYE
jgi:hypothetical protein